MSRPQDHRYSLKNKNKKVQTDLACNLNPKKVKIRTAYAKWK
jgi:hypothetical protein